MKNRLMPLSLLVTAPLLLTQCEMPQQTGNAPVETTKPVEEERPSTAPVPQNVIDDCLAALRQQIPDRAMKVISAKRGETSFIVDIAVAGVPNPWRCFHSGTKVTGTQYQGEG